MGRGPAHRKLGAHDDTGREREFLAGHDFGGRRGRFNGDSETRLEVPIKLLALVVDDGNSWELRELRAQREEGGHARGRVAELETCESGSRQTAKLGTTRHAGPGEVEAVHDIRLGRGAGEE